MPHALPPAVRMNGCKRIELLFPVLVLEGLECVRIHRFPDRHSSVWRDGFHVIWIGHVSADRLGNVFSVHIGALVARRLRGPLLGGWRRVGIVEVVIDGLQLPLQAGRVNPPCKFVDAMSDFMSDLLLLREGPSNKPAL